ncbi:MAG TPA: M20 family metallopeptidase [Vicinamibacterales bacterium]|nr:M20 family metallopeptidase [Vicinamibacterales bacterium]
MTPLLAAAERERAWTIERIRALVQAESPSTDRAALDRCAAVLTAQCREAGATVRREPAGTTADHVVAEWPGARGRALFVGHFDTVWPVGQIARMPLAVVDGRLHGPGVLDMKAGLAVALTAMKVAVAVLPVDTRPAVTLLATSDEEVGSGSSRALLESLARAHDAVLVFEPAIPGGALKTARKGVGEFRVTAHGISSHAGADPGAGASAVHELARQVAVLVALADPRVGRSVNVGVFEGGTRSNVVAETAHALVDVRVSRMADAAGVDAAIRGLRAADPRVRLEVQGGINRPPMERTPGVARLFDLAREVALTWGEDLAEGATGGASDGNFTAALGVPTLDGLGGVGDGPHALHEHVIMDYLPRRAALVAGLVARLGSA